MTTVSKQSDLDGRESQSARGDMKMETSHGKLKTKDTKVSHSTAINVLQNMPIQWQKWGKTAGCDNHKTTLHTLWKKYRIVAGFIDIFCRFASGNLMSLHFQGTISSDWRRAFLINFLTVTTHIVFCTAPTTTNWLCREWMVFYVTWINEWWLDDVR